MSARQIHGCRGAVAVATILMLTGCASSSIQTDAGAFVKEHAITATRVATATKSVEADVSRLSKSPGRTRLQALAQDAAQARRDAVQAGEWNVANSGEGGEEGVEEEDLPRAETEATEAANEIADAMTVLQAYARSPSPAALARYRSKFAHGQEVWDESISQLWYLAHTASPPTV